MHHSSRRDHSPYCVVELDCVVSRPTWVTHAVRFDESILTRWIGCGEDVPQPTGIVETGSGESACAIRLSRTGETAAVGGGEIVIAECAARSCMATARSVV